MWICSDTRRCVEKMQCGDPKTGTLRNASIPDEPLVAIPRSFWSRGRCTSADTAKWRPPEVKCCIYAMILG